MTRRFGGRSIPKGIDGHVHFRQGSVLQTVLPYTARDFAYGIAMPNTTPPVWNADGVRAYSEELRAASPGGFTPLMVIYLMEHTTPDIIRDAKMAGAKAAKFYPRDGTFNSHHGLDPRFFLEQLEWFAALQEANMVLCIHPEIAGLPHSVRESEFLKLFVDADLPPKFPKLKFVIEHVSTAFGLQVIEKYPNVYGTVTAHHLILTSDDVYGKPHNYCLPVAKSARDRSALQNAVVLSKRRDLFFGSDSAPHPLSAKSAVETKPGVYSAEEIYPLLAGIFVNEIHGGQIRRMEEFTAGIGLEVYELAQSHSVIELYNHTEPRFIRNPIPVVRPEREVDDDAPTDPPPPKGEVADPIIPFYAGKPIYWSVNYDR